MATQSWRQLAPFNSTVGLGCNVLGVTSYCAHGWPNGTATVGRSLLVVWNEIDPFTGEYKARSRHRILGYSLSWGVKKGMVARMSLRLLLFIA